MAYNHLNYPAVTPAAQSPIAHRSIISFQYLTKAENVQEQESIHNEALEYERREMNGAKELKRKKWFFF